VKQKFDERQGNSTTEPTQTRNLNIASAVFNTMQKDPRKLKILLWITLWLEIQFA